MMKLITTTSTAPVATLVLVFAVAANASSGGPVVGWGNNFYGQTSIPDSVNGTDGTASAIAAGDLHACAIQAGTGNVICWGNNDFGQASPPASVDGTSGTASAIAAGGQLSGGHSCAIQAGTGNVVCWGRDNDGQSSPPDSVNGTSGTAIAIEASYYDSCAIQAGTENVVCWGDQGPPPDSVNGTSGTASVIAGGKHNCAIQAGTGNAVCWGSAPPSLMVPPASVDGTSGTASAIGTGGGGCGGGSWHSCAIQAETGNVICWGDLCGSTHEPPDSVNGTSGTASALATGIEHDCAIQAGTEDVVCWGNDSSGETSPPDSVTSMTGTASAIASGYNTSYAIQTKVAFDWVTVVDPGNACDTQPQGCFGSVAEFYRISKYEVTNAQYTQFLNAVAATDTDFLWYSKNAGTHGGITRSGSSGSYRYSVIAGRGDMPVNQLSFWDAARFANWLHNGQPSGAQDNSTTEDGAYTLTPTGIANNTVTRNAGARFFIPSEDEWYKAAYYDPGAMLYFDYPAGSDTQTTCTVPGAAANTANCHFATGTPTDENGDPSDAGSYPNSASPNGTFDQGGNMWEWTEAIVNSSERSLRGGDLTNPPDRIAASFQLSHACTVDCGSAGLRVASPHPTDETSVPALPPLGIAMLIVGLLGVVGGTLRKLHRAS